MKKETKINQPEWAMEKVRALAPASTEKITLLAIARFSKPDGSGCFAKIKTLAHYLGRSERTVQYHIRKLVQRGELWVDLQADKKYRTNKYIISVCRLTAQEREAITGISTSQIRMPFQARPQISQTEVTPQGDQRSADTLTMVQDILKNLAIADQVLKEK